MARKLTRPRPERGIHLAELRQRAGLSQDELARLIGVSQQNVAFWESSESPPRSDVLPKLAQVLDVSLEELLGVRCKTKRRPGPAGKLRRIFEEAYKLPRGQQEKIAEVVSLFVQHYQSQAKKNH